MTLSEEPEHSSSEQGQPEQTRPAPVGNQQASSIPEVLPVLPLRDSVVYPMSVFPLAIANEKAIKLIDDVVVSGNRLIAVVAQKEAPEQTETGSEEYYDTGTAVRILQMMKVPDGSLRLAVQGLERIRIVEFIEKEPYLKARVEAIPDVEDGSVEVAALMSNALALFQRLVSLVPYLPEELITTAINLDQPRQLAYLIATSLRMDLPQRQEILELPTVKEKLEKLTKILNSELEVLELGQKIQSQVQDEMSKVQREYFLREQLKAIQKELGEQDEQTLEINRLREAIQNARMPEEAEKEASRELDRLAKMPIQAPEYSVIKTYLDWLVTLPWNTSTEGEIDIAHTRQILNEDHYDLDKIKERILEYLSVRKLRQEREKDGPVGDIHEPILCFVGPPGVGKTSLAQSIARALGRKLVRMSLGGVRDEAEIRGHRRTYVGAMPGRIIQAIRRGESNDPVFVLDEVDKLGMDFRGDPTSALLEVLDPEQNRDFRDHYLDVPFDLSKVMFITTANQLEPVPPPLRDRMEILQLAGYTEEEKVKIAQRFLIPKQMKAHAIREDEVVFDEDAVLTIVRDYTREAGVRNLEREIATAFRKIARVIAEGSSDGELVKPVRVTAEKIREYLGRQRFFTEVAERTKVPGVATGLAWTPVGGDIMFIEATKMRGSKTLTVTGQLGDVMKESAQAALSYVRSRAESLGIPPDFFEKTDIHIHVPAGATPKDGPSAGITMTTALVSLLTNRPVKDDVAMTGEITLRGRVLPIGGLKEKVLAAHRAGLRTIIMPAKNEPDLDDLPADLRKEMTFIPVETMDQVIAAALSDHLPSVDGVGPMPTEEEAKILTN